MAFWNPQAPPVSGTDMAGKPLKAERVPGGPAAIRDKKDEERRRRRQQQGHHVEDWVPAEEHKLDLEA